VCVLPSSRSRVLMMLDDQGIGARMNALHVPLYYIEYLLYSILDWIGFDWIGLDWITYACQM